MMIGLTRRMRLVGWLLVRFNWRGGLSAWKIGEWRGGDGWREQSVGKCNFMRGLRLLLSYPMHA